MNLNNEKHKQQQNERVWIKKLEKKKRKREWERIIDYLLRDIVLKQVNVIRNKIYYFNNKNKTKQ